MNATLAVRAETALPETPYQGLVPYGEEDAAFFFGRNEWREIIIDNLKAYRLTLLYGESGVGKSSVLRAGVAHELREGARQNQKEDGAPGLVVSVFGSWREDPLAGLIRGVCEATAVALSEAPADPPPSLDLESALDECARRAGGRLLVILDQFEEYFLYHSHEQGKETFAEAFPRAVSRPDLRASFLISIREDALAKLDRFKTRIPNLFDNCLRIERLNREDAREAIEKPLAEYNRRAEFGQEVALGADLVETILDEVEAGKVVVGHTGAGVVDREKTSNQRGIEAPYLQLVLTRLWGEELRAGSRVLRLETLRSLGGADGIVRAHLDGAMNALPPAERDVAARLFQHLVTPSGTKIAQRASDLATYVERPEAEITAILEKLSGDARILRPVGGSSYEIYHDALAGPILDWGARWQEQQKRIRDRRKMTLVGAAALISTAVAIGVVVLALVALGERNKARHQTELVNLARSRELARSAISRLQIAPEESLRLALQAADAAETPDAESALRAALATPRPSALLRAQTGRIIGAVFSPNGKLVVTTGEDGPTKIWRTTSGGAEATLLGKKFTGGPGSGFPIPRSAVFSPDSKFVVTVGDQGTAQVWRATSGELVTVLGHKKHRRHVWDAAFSRDGKLVVTASSDGAARIWQTGSWRPVAVLPGKRGIRGAAFSPDGKRIVTAGMDGESRIWDLRRRLVVAVLPGGATPPYGKYVPYVRAAFSPNGRLVLMVSPDGVARVWDVAHKRPIRITKREKKREKAFINSAVFSPDGKLFVTAGEDGTARLWSAATGELRQTMSTHAGEVVTAAFSADSNRIVTAGTAGRVQLWEVGVNKPLAVVRAQGRGHIVWTAAFSPDGRRIVAGGDDRTARLWDVAGEQPTAVLGQEGSLDIPVPVSIPDANLVATFATISGPRREQGVTLITRIWTVHGKQVAVLRGFGEAFSPSGKLVVLEGENASQLRRVANSQQVAVLGVVYNASFSPDGNLIATNSYLSRAQDSDPITRVWTARGKQVAVLRGSGSAFSPDGKRIVTVGKDGAARIWQAANGQSVAVLRGQRCGRRYCATSARFSPDGSMLVVGSEDGTAQVWETASGKRGAHWQTNAVFGSPYLVFSPDGKLIVDRSGYTRTRVWSASTGQRRPSLEGQFGAFSPNNKLVLTVSNGTARLSQVANSQLVAVLGAAQNATFSRDGKWIVTGNRGAARVYACETCGSIQDLMRLAHRRLRHDPKRAPRG